MKSDVRFFCLEECIGMSWVEFWLKHCYSHQFVNWKLFVKFCANRFILKLICGGRGFLNWPFWIICRFKIWIFWLKILSDFRYQFHLRFKSRVVNPFHPSPFFCKKYLNFKPVTNLSYFVSQKNRKQHVQNFHNLAR